MTGLLTFQGWFSPGQVFVLDEYCARYMVRGCHRHVSLLSDLLNKADEGFLIDPTLMHYSFAFCASHVHGNRYHFYLTFVSGYWGPSKDAKYGTLQFPFLSMKQMFVHLLTVLQWIAAVYAVTFRPDGVGTVTLEEKEKFQDVKERLRTLLEKQITNFRCWFYTMVTIIL